jgi:hypothetical protein
MNKNKNKKTTARVGVVFVCCRSSLPTVHTLLVQQVMSYVIHYATSWMMRLQVGNLDPVRTSTATVVACLKPRQPK